MCMCIFLCSLNCRMHLKHAQFNFTYDIVCVLACVPLYRNRECRTSIGWWKKYYINWVNCSDTDHICQRTITTTFDWIYHRCSSNSLSDGAVVDNKKWCRFIKVWVFCCCCCPFQSYRLFSAINIIHFNNYVSLISVNMSQKLLFSNRHRNPQPWYSIHTFTRNGT